MVGAGVRYQAEGGLACLVMEANYQVDFLISEIRPVFI